MLKRWPRDTSFSFSPYAGPLQPFLVKCNFFLLFQLVHLWTIGTLQKGVPECLQRRTGNGDYAQRGTHTLTSSWGKEKTLFSVVLDKGKGLCLCECVCFYQISAVFVCQSQVVFIHKLLCIFLFTYTKPFHNDYLGTILMVHILYVLNILKLKVQGYNSRLWSNYVNTILTSQPFFFL